MNTMHTTRLILNDRRLLRSLLGQRFLVARWRQRLHQYAPTHRTTRAGHRLHRHTIGAVMNEQQAPRARHCGAICVRLAASRCYTSMRYRHLRATRVHRHLAERHVAMVTAPAAATARFRTCRCNITSLNYIPRYHGAFQFFSLFQ